jgi:nucleotide-binding universal stress UspA family protein
MKILICADPAPASLLAGKLVSKFGFSADTKITVLGVSEKIEELDKLTNTLEEINSNLGNYNSVERKIRKGDPTEEIISEAVDGAYDLVAVGGGSGQLDYLHPKLGSTTSKLSRKLHTHFLVARNVPQKISKVLFCAGSDLETSRTMKLGGGWISRIPAQVGLLHVMSKSVSTTNTGDSILQIATQQLNDAGISNPINGHIRRGLIVQEVLNEIAEVGYELLVIGAHYQPGKDLWQGTLFDDVTDQLLNRSTCSVLVI